MATKRILFLSGFAAAPASAQTSFLYQKAFINDPTCSVEEKVAYGNAFSLDTCLKALVNPSDPNGGAAFFKTAVVAGDGTQAETKQYSGEGCTGTETSTAVYSKATDGNTCDGAFTENGVSGNYLLEFPSARRSVRQAAPGVDVKIYPGAGCTAGTGETTSNLFLQPSTCTDTTFERNGAAFHYITGYVNPENVVIFQSFSDSGCATSRYPYAHYAPLDTCLTDRNGAGSVMFVSASASSSSVVVPPTTAPSISSVSSDIPTPSLTTTATDSNTSPPPPVSTTESSAIVSSSSSSSTIGSFTDTTTNTNDASTSTVAPTVNPTPEPNPSSGPNLGLIIGASCGGVLALVAGAGLIYFCTRRRSRNDAATKDPLPRDELNATDALPPAIIAVSKPKGVAKNSSWPVPTNGQPKAQPWTAWSDVMLVEKVGTGTFGTVSKGHLRQDGHAYVVAVRVLEKEGMTSSDDFVTIAEAEGQLKLSHPNLVTIYSVSYDTEDPRAPLATILEWMDGGSLASHVRTRAAEGNPLRAEERLYILTEAAKGLNYLTSMRFTHQGISAKNILLGSPVASAAGDSGKMVVKVSDYGIWRPTRYNQMVKNDEDHVRWMAPESLHPNRPVFTEQSDVYSFGVLIWEVFNECSTIPWGEKSNSDAASAVRRGQRLSNLQRCPIPMIRLLNKCTEFDPRQRGTFQTVLDDLAAMAGTSWIAPSHASFEESRSTLTSQTPSNM
eukprot:comp23104_c0_seq1/m.37155 comp23104_c0_seq1/g.37155  ORF comp23104_c0_seq1/g.37155 comp23104_c0_seq1/m.37155 type:complete len:726 (-) comp23104_c0_seq1:88-2265(-)